MRTVRPQGPTFRVTQRYGLRVSYVRMHPRLRKDPDMPVFSHHDYEKLISDRVVLEPQARCERSRAWDPRNDFSQCMQQHKVPSTSSAISPQQERTDPSEHRPCRRGVKSSLRREPDVPGDLLRALIGNVTEPM
jgi:hypothetical protein